MTAHDWNDFFMCAVGGGCLGYFASKTIEHWRRRPFIYRDARGRLHTHRPKGG